MAQYTYSNTIYLQRLEHQKNVLVVPPNNMNAHVKYEYRGYLCYFVDYASDKSYYPESKRYKVPFDEFKNQFRVFPIYRDGIDMLSI